MVPLVVLLVLHVDRRHGLLESLLAQCLVHILSLGVVGADLWEASICVIDVICGQRVSTVLQLQVALAVLDGRMRVARACVGRLRAHLCRWL